MISFAVDTSASVALAREAASVGRFLEILEAYREVPVDLLRSIQPDPYEVTAGKALEPLEKGSGRILVLLSLQ